MTNRVSLKQAAFLVSVAFVTIANVGVPQASSTPAPLVTGTQIEVAAHEAESTLPEGPYALAVEPAVAPPVESLPISNPADEDRALANDLRQYYASARGSRVAANPVPSPVAVNSGPPIAGAASVPVLMYHHVAVTGPGDDAIRRDLSVSPSNFAAQMGYLARNGYTAMSLADLDDHLEHSRPLPARPVVLTFDDGYADNFSAAFPTLLQNGFTGTFFLITDYVGRGEYMSWDQARVLLAMGMSVQSHTLDHPDLATLSSDRLARQLSQSKAAIERELGSSVSLLCYPSGKYNATVVRAAEQAGYLAAVTTVYGDSHQPGHPFEISRVRIRGSDGLDAFAAKVRGPTPSSTGTAQTK